MAEPDTLADSITRARETAIDNGIGTVQIWAGATDRVPSGWLLCDGSELDSNNKLYLALFLVIGMRYGAGQHATGFKIPNLDKRIVVGSSKGDPAYAVGSAVGQDMQSTTFTPSLVHQSMADAMQVNTENGFQTNPVVGANQQTILYDARQASVVMSYIIKYQ